MDIFYCIPIFTMKLLNESPTATQETFSRDTLHEAFLDITASTYKGVQGVKKIDSGKPGPTVGITALTHGNEPSGLAPMVNPDRIQERLQSGSVLLIVNNIEAARAYFAATCDDDRKKLRSLDENMNRLPND